MRRTLLAALAVASLALALAAPATAKSEHRSDAAANARAAEHQRILDYWTQARRDNARPRDIVMPLGTKPRPAAKPGGGGGGTTSPSLNSTGSAWTFGGPVAQTTGKVFFTLGGGNYVCSGSLVQGPTSTSPPLVSTAGHCTHEGDGSGPAGYATNFAFYPGYAGTTSGLPKYTATSSNLFATTNWQNNGAAHRAYPDDAAFARVTGPAPSTTPPRVTFSRTTSGQMFAFGYPAAQKYKGNKLIYCSGTVSLGYYDGDDTISMPCGMTGGSSGGPWFANFSTTDKSGVQVSVNSYGYSGISRMWGPVFDTAESNAYSAASQ